MPAAPDQVDQALQGEKDSHVVIFKSHLPEDERPRLGKRHGSLSCWSYSGVKRAITVLAASIVNEQDVFVPLQEPDQPTKRVRGLAVSMTSE